MATTMNAWDALSAGLAECYVTLDGRRYKFMQAINLEASIEKKKMQVRKLCRCRNVRKSPLEQRKQRI